MKEKQLRLLSEFVWCYQFDDKNDAEPIKRGFVIVDLTNQDRMLLDDGLIERNQASTINPRYQITQKGLETFEQLTCADYLRKDVKITTPFDSDTDESDTAK